ncbi:MAG: hypothetical protein P1U83_11405 [Roseovarius sp.]|nr:hypothetical protein [Roseovarius sp.]
MASSSHITLDEQRSIDEAMQLGDIEQVFRLLAAHLSRNKLTLSDDILKLYLEQELFACLKGRGHFFESI